MLIDSKTQAFDLIYDDAEKVYSLSKRLSNDIEFLKELLAVNSGIYKYLPEKIKLNTDLTKYAIKLDFNMYKYVPKEIKKNIEFIKGYLYLYPYGIINIEERYVENNNFRKNLVGYLNSTEWIERMKNCAIFDNYYEALMISEFIINLRKPDYTHPVLKYFILDLELFDIDFSNTKDLYIDADNYDDDKGFGILDLFNSENINIAHFALNSVSYNVIEHFLCNHEILSHKIDKNRIYLLIHWNSCKYNFLNLEISKIWFKICKTHFNRV